MPSVNLYFDNIFKSFDDALIIPRSTIGTISEPFTDGLKNILFLDVPSFFSKPLGSLDAINYDQLRQRSNNLKPSFDILYATTVENNTSSYQAINSIIDLVTVFTKNNPDVRDVASPLLGTGAGGLDPVKVFELMKMGFISNAREDCILDIFVLDENIYNELIHHENMTSNENVLLDGNVKFINEENKKKSFFLQLKSIPCYLVGSSWNGTDNQSERFFKDGIWENGREDKFKELVNKIEPGNVLFLKSTYATGKKSYLRLKAAGIVTDNPRDGKLLKVDWKVKNVQYDIANKGSYRSTVAKVNDQVIKDLLGSLVDWEVFKIGLFGETEVQDDNLNYNDILNLEVEGIESIKQSRQSIESTFLTDYYAEKDLLNYELYAATIVSFINHKNTKPPLTIGIMAPWGKGKTSLMRFIEKKLKNLKPVITEIKKEQKDSRFFKLLNIKKENGTASFSMFNSWINSAKNNFKFEKTLQYPTVWFNAWKFQKNEQIWAGFAHEIINQLVEQLPNELAKEEFWLRLNLKRIDQEKLKNKIRFKIYNKLITSFIGLVISGLTIFFCFIAHTQMVIGYGACGAFLGMLFFLFKSKLRVENEKVDFDITKFLKQPNYESKRGYFHEVEEDLKEVMNILISKDYPAVIFIDDLDRCAPNTVSEVVEAINLFISGDFPRCYFILGQDAQMVAASLDVAYDKIGDKASALYREQGSLGWHFMEKFIQLQFSIPVISEEQSIVFFKSFFKTNITDESEDTKIDVIEKIQKIQEKIDAAANLGELLDTDMILLENDLRTIDPVRAVRLQEQIIKKAAEEYDDNDPEVINLIEHLSVFIGTSPRTIKRFINLYRFYRFLQFTNRNTSLKNISNNHIGQWIVFMIRWPQLVRAIQWNTENDFISGNTALERAISFENNILKYSYSEWEEVVTNGAPNLKWLKDVELYKFIRLCKKDSNQLKNAVSMGVW